MKIFAILINFPKLYLLSKDLRYKILSKLIIKKTLGNIPEGKIVLLYAID